MPKLPLPLEGKLSLRKLMATGLDQALFEARRTLSAR